MKPSIAIALVLAIAPSLIAQPKNESPFSVVEATIPEMQAAMKEGRVTSRELVLAHLARIAIYEDRLNAVVAVNPRALEEAEERDRERAEGRVRGPLHGIPVALKDNIHTTDIPTTGGALAFEGFRPSVRRDTHPEPSRRRRHHRRQDRSHRARELGRERDARQLQRRRRATE